ncbi:MAG: DUF4298 domain-containing protein [Candidatus Limivicinus sp.]|jgi:DNA-binding transcriptional regulator/RsmH inhibitor MraZ
MDKKYEHITRMENIMTRQENTVKKLEAVLEELDSQQADYEALTEYYYSDRRMQDLEDEERHLIPEDLRRGVLSEDEVYNLFLDSHDAAIHMLETALKLLKTN